MRRIFAQFGLCTVLISAPAIAVGWYAARAGAQPPAEHEPVHADAEAILQAAADALRAALLEDKAAVRAALDIQENNCRRLRPEERDTLGGEIYATDLAMHETLTRAREFATRGDLDQVIEHFRWIYKSCRKCHRLAREGGLLDTDSPLALQD